MTSALPKGTRGSVASLLATTRYQKNPDRNHNLHKLGNIVSSEIYTLYAGAAGMLLHINGKFTMGKLKMILNMHMQVKTVQHLAYPRLIADQLNLNQVRQVGLGTFRFNHRYSTEY